MQPIESPPLAVSLQRHFLQLLEDTGLTATVPPHELQAGLTHIQLGLGQLLADVERARVRGIPLNVAVHAHESFPYLGRFHGWLHDAFVMQVPGEIVPIARRILSIPTPAWTVELQNAFSIIARSGLARSDERALATLLLFEGIRFNLFIAAYRMNGWWEGVGGCRRTLDDLAWKEAEVVLAMPMRADEEDMTFNVIVVDAMHRLGDCAQQLWAAQEMIEDLRQACAERARAEMVFREADPVDAAVLRNYFDRAEHQQPIPMSRLPLEHPLVLEGHNEESLHARVFRATKKLATKVKRPRPTTVADLIAEMEPTNA